MADDTSKYIVLDVDDWMDAPQPVIDALQACRSGKTVIDASEANSVCAQVAQLLVVARQSAIANSGSFEIDRPSDAVKRSLGLLGLSALLLDQTS